MGQARNRLHPAYAGLSKGRIRWRDVREVMAVHVTVRLVWDGLFLASLDLWFSPGLQADLSYNHPVKRASPACKIYKSLRSLFSRWYWKFPRRHLRPRFLSFSNLSSLTSCRTFRQCVYALRTQCIAVFCEGMRRRDTSVAEVLGYENFESEPNPYPCQHIQIQSISSWI